MMKTISIIFSKYSLKNKSSTNVSELLKMKTMFNMKINGFIFLIITNKN